MKLLKFASALAGIVQVEAMRILLILIFVMLISYERGQQRGFIEELILKTDGFGQDIVAIENVLIKNFLIQQRLATP